MRVAVTGASGFVGRHVVEKLLAQGADVVAAIHATSLAERPGLRQVALDLSEPPADPFTHLHCPDALVHLAWGGLPHYRASHHLDTELPLQRAFLRACLSSGLRRLVVAGTCLEYGMAEGERAETDATAPVTAYAQAKLQLLDALRADCEAHDTDLTWLRLFYVYGDGQAPTSLRSQLQAAVRAGASTFAMSPGDQLRDFLPIDSAADHIARIAMHAPDAGIVNICSGRPIEVHAIVRKWLQSWGADIHLDRGVHSYPDYEPFAFWGSVRKLHAMLGQT